MSLQNLEWHQVRDEWFKPGRLGGVAEIASLLIVSRSRVSQWAARRDKNGFPKPVLDLAMGPVYDLYAVNDWYIELRKKVSA